MAATNVPARKGPSSMPEHPISKLEKSLAKLGVFLEQKDRARMLDVVSTTPYTEKRIVKFMENYPALSLGDALDCLEMVGEYGTKLFVVEGLLKKGFLPTQISDYMEIRPEISPREVKFRRLPLTDEERFLPLLSEHISYHNVLFLDDISGGGHDMNTIKELIGRVRERSEEAYRFSGRKEMGTGVIIHLMKDMYESQRSKGCEEDFDTLLSRVLGNLPTEFCRVAEG